ncbi:exodeoxyribonuclease VII small subunit [Ottowia testudinis]|uniref:Exodeoxyribonuclease 7 small subunit n=1 Tax=Ottowia testudinis TaxID=2816950 RepID=A0A975CEY7_9BURK|nr:exodeoxyribonuclease VII small subunit [Ottowia testudinis]QTD44541.1 exodeoxyribonuclease VII small subunit [Ottowia testudinis]
MPRKSATSSTLPATYGDAVLQLERLVDGLEADQLPLEELLGQYQRGSELLRYCRDRLQAVEDHVKLLGDGGSVKPWVAE